jgi:hypothetical protein
LAALLACAALAAGCSGGEDEPETAPRADGNTQATEAKHPDAGPAGDAVELYFTAGEQFHPVERELPDSGSPVEQAAEALVAGPNRNEQQKRVEAQTQIPRGVNVRDVTVSQDGTATVEVSREFLAGVPVDESRRTREEQQVLDARLGQVTYTLTQFKKVQDAKVVSGGIGVEPALARQDYRKPSRPPDSPPRPRGAKSTATRSVQERLAQLHYLPKSAIDGVNGYRTQQAVIAFQSWEGLARDGIAGPVTRAALASARRPKPRAGGGGRRIEVFRERGVALLVKDGRTKRAVHVSTGAPGYTTPAGSFSVFRKERMSWSVPFSQWLPWASYFFQGIAFHEYASVPTYPASHGCVRVPEPEARYLYRFADIGLRVVVF